MEGLTFVLFVTLVVLIYKLMSKVNRIEKKIEEIFQQNQLGSLPKEHIKPSTQAQDHILKKKITPTPAIEHEPKIVDQPPTENSKKEISYFSERSIITPPKKKIVTVPKPSFMERNPDLEKFIGENLLSKIGIVIFVIGMGFLVKLGIDNNVITEGMRVAIGILIGGGMIGLAHYLRNSFAKFSSILIGGALSVLYFTIALAFHEYALIPQTAAFIIMVIITAFGVLLSIAYDRKTLAVLAIIGGFGTPFFISTGSGNYSVLLTYILILDIGMLTLVYFKKWNIINYLTYGFTYLLFTGVYSAKFIGNEEATRWPLILFLTAFYLIFYLMTIIYNIKNTKKFKYPEIAMLLSNTSIYFGFGLSLVHGYNQGLYSGVFTAITAVFNFGFAYALHKRKNIDKNLLFLLIGLVLTLVSLIAPIQLEGNYITIFWAIEGVLLLWLSQKSGITIMKVGALIVSVLMLISLSMDWQQNYYPYYDYVVLHVFLNKAFVTSFVAMISFIGMTLLLKKDEIIEIKGFHFVWKSIHMKVALAAIIYLGFLFELNYQFVRFEFVNSLRVILLGIYNYSIVLIILRVNQFKSNNLLQKSSFLLSSIVVGSYLTTYLNQVAISRSYYLLEQQEMTGYYWHYVLFALFVVILVQLTTDIYKKHSFKSKTGTIALWILAFVGVYVSTAEVSHLSMLYQFSSGREDYQAFDIAVKSVFPVVWALTALILMALGMKFRLKTLRIASLSIFSITIIKLFVYDLAGNSTGKIVSFILLGVILLLISFLYQKLKFILQDDDEKKG